MRCLWLTLADPDPPTNGQYLYSGGLIRAAAAAGLALDVLALARPDAPRPSNAGEDGITWRLGEYHARPAWREILSPLPRNVSRTRIPVMRDMLSQLLSGGRWNAIVFDSITPGWALGPVLAYRRAAADHGPTLVYIAHNREKEVSAKAVEAETGWLRRSIKRLDALKTSRLEYSLARHADIITAISPEDFAQFRASWPNKRVELLLPGYSGKILATRRIDASAPRRAVILGSFDWLLKRANLTEFLRVADPLFAAAGAELRVVGSAEEAFLDGLRRRVSATVLTGRVEDVASHLQDARIAIVPERLGGGFKLKLLDYVFHRLPIAAISGSISGIPLAEGESVALYPDHESLARGVIDMLDDVETLDRMQQAAYEACRTQFDWRTRGRQLAAAIENPAILLREGGTGSPGSQPQPRSASLGSSRIG